MSDENFRRAARKAQPRSQVTKSAVLEAAIQEFAAFGPDGARIENIAARAGVNKQALYYHYGNKDVLFAAALASVYEKGSISETDWSDGKVSPLVAMRHLIAAVFDELHANDEDAALILHENRQRGVHLTPDVKKRIRTSVLPIRLAIGNVLKRGQSEGVFGKAIDVDNVYLSIVAMCMFYFTHSYTLSAILERDLLNPKRVRSWKRHVEDFVIDALRP